MAVAVLAAPVPAWADPAQPTNYNSEVTSIEPADPAVSARVVGGDSFLRLTVAAPAEVVVMGYGQEPYIRFDRLGTVWVNTRSPAHFLNQDRYGQTPVPSSCLLTTRPNGSG